MSQQKHISVMLDEVVEYTSPKDDEIYVDCTFGAGGYSAALLKSANCKIIAIDRDPNVKEIADQLEKEYPGRVQFVSNDFGNLKSILSDLNIEKVNAVILDIGVSSMQIDNADRGFSFKQDGPLDMRMSQEGISAEYVVNNYSESDIANIIYKYGGERKSRQIARAIVNKRDEMPITTTKQLADIIRGVVRQGKDKIDPATRSFQGIRIYVNDELKQLEDALHAAHDVLSEDGRLVVVTFHSLEDSIVKDFFKEKSGKAISVSRHMPPISDNDNVASLKPLTRKPVLPSDKEIESNIRSRSAKLRAAIKIAKGGV